MKWITREHPRVDRVACPRLIEKSVDPQAEFSYVPADQVMVEAQKRGATPYDVKDAELHYPNDQKQREASRPVLDALYAYCQKKVEAKPA